MGKNSAGREARRARKEEEEREARVKSGTASIRGMFEKQFNDKYYADALETQKAQYAGEFGTQWENARKSLETALLRAGLYDSTEGNKRRADAELEKGRRQMEINSRAQAAVDSRKQNVLAAQDNVIGQLRSSADLNAANAAASQQLAAQNTPIPYSPLGSVFTDFTAGLAEQGEQIRQGTNRYNFGSGVLGGGKRYTTNVGGS